MMDIEKRKSAAFEWIENLGIKIPYDIGLTLLQLTKPSPHVSEPYKLSEQEHTALNKALHASVTVINEGIADGEVDKSLLRVANFVSDFKKGIKDDYDLICCTGVENTCDLWLGDIETLIRAAQQQIPDRKGQLSLCASGLISLLYQEPDDVKQIREYIVPELRSCLATDAQQPRQECPHNCPHCYAIEVRNNLSSAPKETT